MRWETSKDSVVVCDWSGGRLEREEVVEIGVGA